MSEIKALEDEKIVYDINPDKLELAPAKLITNLVKAVQELSSKNTVLEARFTSPTTVLLSAVASYSVILSFAIMRSPML